ncbi:cytochrome c [Mariprofundus erugo]|uniref:Cytochrome c n=1 Tax=Mariprofundus erugo TaxID=2528639 RepID=A0A5R9GL48_9PROT|nr:cytochrome c [Mariprofundus erugo]TLS66458.1 cytochrome c [Mariprofundus erugo]TLS77896.1 cytochrome c [Mariprofundus erugo]
MLKKIPWMAVVNTAILLLAGVFIVAVVQSMIHPGKPDESEKGLPYYTTADAALVRSGTELYKQLQCRSCHKIWAVKNMYDTVPAPSLDGIGSLRTEEWLYNYFSSENPQSILPSRLKEKYRMPSYAKLSEDDRRLLAAYFASLKVRGWYLDQTREAEQKKLMGN